jgi:hypothetical protein
MEPDGSLPCSQEPATGPYPGSDEAIFKIQKPISLRCSLTSPIHACVFEVDPFLQVPPFRLLYAFLTCLIRATSPAALILLD